MHAPATQEASNSMDGGPQRSARALDHLPSDLYFSSETDSPTLGVESRAPLDMSEYELSPGRYAGSDCSVEEVRGAWGSGQGFARSTPWLPRQFIRFRRCNAPRV
jgi:hypothetical protein